MSNELEQKIMSLINGAETAIPEVAQEYLAWGVISSIFVLILCSTVIIISLFVFKRNGCFKAIKHSPTPKGVLAIGLVVAILLSVPCLPINIYNIIKIKTAPKVYLIDALRSK